MPTSFFSDLNALTLFGSYANSNDTIYIKCLLPNNKNYHLKNNNKIRVVIGEGIIVAILMLAAMIILQR